MKIIFTQNFTSTLLGNVYIGKKIDLDTKTAKKFIANGQAKELVEEKAKQPSKEVEDNGADKPKRSKKPFARRSK